VVTWKAGIMNNGPGPEWLIFPSNWDNIVITPTQGKELTAYRNENSI